MAEENTAEPNLFARSVVLRVPGVEAVEVIRDQPWGDERAFDLYRPPGASEPAPVVVFVTGFPDPGFRAFAGCALKDTAPYRSWARLLAASGLAAVTYTNVEPATDARAILDHLHQHAAELGIDPARCGLWASSGNVPNALAVLGYATRLSVRCAALCYGYMVDADGATAVADAGGQFGFVVPEVSVDQIPPHVPLLIARAGADATPGLNDSIDRFVRRAESRALEVEMVEHPTGPHAFDVMDDSDASRRVIRRVLAFLKERMHASEFDWHRSQYPRRVIV